MISPTAAVLGEIGLPAPVRVAVPQIRVLFLVVLPTKGTVFANACHEGFDFLPMTIFRGPVTRVKPPFASVM
jgi:hypothetical protein